MTIIQTKKLNDDAVEVVEEITTTKTQVIQYSLKQMQELRVKTIEAHDINLAAVDEKIAFITAELAEE